MYSNRRKSQRRQMKALIICAFLMFILIIALVIVIILEKNNKNTLNDSKQTSASITEASKTVSETDTPKETDKETDKETVSESTGEASTASTEETLTNAPTESASSEELPTQNYGKWDLSILETDTVPFGNDPNSVTAAGIPNGVFWYTTKYGEFKVDFISDIGHKWNKGESTEKLIYLTMDCGFDNEHTGPILDILKEKGVKATFFVTSMFYDARPDLIKRMIDEGHRIGSHSINHYDMTTLSIEQQQTEILDVVNKLKNDFGYDCRLFRFPTGNFSKQCLAVVENLGMKSVFWSYAYNDYSTTQPDVAESLQKAIKYVHPGAIYLLHASSSTNRAFLAEWIDAVRAQGYEFAGVYPVD